MNNQTPLSDVANIPASSDGEVESKPQNLEIGQTDILVIGAGPSGAATAITLARAGLQVTLIDQHNFPRDKVCGDGLIPDSLQALEQLGVLDQVMQKAHPVAGLVCKGPAGGALEIPGRLAVLPRRELDFILVKEAQRLGVQLQTPVKFLRPEFDAVGTIIGARVSQNQHESSIRARWTILATGAATGPIKAAGMCLRSLPSAMALRTYIRNTTWEAHPNHLEIRWHKSYAPGYGWVFPCGEGVYNVGVGLYGMHQRSVSQRLCEKLSLGRAEPEKQNLHDLFNKFMRSHPHLQKLMDEGEFLSDIKGAPLRCSLEGALSDKAGMLVTGEALGSTYALTGEGIGKAMETGILAAKAIIAESSNQSLVQQTYQSSLNDIRHKFAIYQKANIINQMPWLIDLAIKRANASPRLLNRMSLVLEEKANPARLFTLKGAWKFLTE